MTINVHKAFWFLCGFGFLIFWKQIEFWSSACDSLDLNTSPFGHRKCIPFNSSLKWSLGVSLFAVSQILCVLIFISVIRASHCKTTDFQNQKYSFQVSGLSGYLYYLYWCVCKTSQQVQKTNNLKLFDFAAQLFTLFASHEIFCRQPLWRCVSL